MKKGFTLVELLAVIVILALVLAIAVPTISKLIETSQAEAYHSSEQLILKSAKLYAATNQSVLPQNIGDTTSVLLSDLVSANYLSNITDPYDKSNCSGYITIIKTDVSQFEYTPHIHCDSNINSTTEDQLVYHYKFDDFQEPTTNSIPNPTKIGGSGWMNGNATVELNSIKAPDGTMSATKITTTTTTQSRSEYWEPVQSVDTIYNFSVYAKRGSTPYAGLFTYFAPYFSPSLIVNLDTGLVTDSTGVLSYSIENVGDGWWHIEMSSLVKPDQTYRIFKLIQTSSPTNANGGVANDYVYYWGAQLEKKSYNTSFVNGSRTGIIKDYSGNNKTITLAEGTTPRWINDAQQKGTYYFDGVKTSFPLPDPQLTQNVFTLNFWMNPSSSGSTSRFLTPASTGIDQYLTYEQSSQRMGLHIAEAGDTNARNIYSTVGSIPTDQWTMVTLVINGQTCQIYINGKLNVESVETIPIALWASHWTLGQRSNNTYFYKGYFDDIRLYKRALSENEIRNIYNGVK